MQSPREVDWPHSELIKTRVAHGFCSRDPVAGACPYSNICEQCDNFVPDPEQANVLEDQRDDIQALLDDAIDRGWTDEAARHERVVTILDSHVRRVGRATSASDTS